MAEFINTIDLLGEEATIDGLIEDTITEFYDNVLTDVGYGAFSNSHVQIVKLPSVSCVGSGAFTKCTSLRWIEFKEVVSIGDYALHTVNSLETLILRSETMCDIGICSMSKPYIYVPKALIEDYKVATNWSVYADRFRALEDYTVDGTITGELDENKI